MILAHIREGKHMGDCGEKKMMYPGLEEAREWSKTITRGVTEDWRLKCPLSRTHLISKNISRSMPIASKPRKPATFPWPHDIPLHLPARSAILSGEVWLEVLGALLQEVSPEPMCRRYRGLGCTCLWASSPCLWECCRLSGHCQKF